MPIASHFYNESTKKYIAVFGTLFNEISIIRDDNAGTEQQRLLVPISYGPYQKFLARITQDPELSQKSAITLPRMSFEITGMSYDGQRKLSSLNYVDKKYSGSSAHVLYSPTPYNIEFSLYIMTKYAEDGVQIIEQILPFFSPDLTASVEMISGYNPVDVPVILNSVSTEDVYESDFVTRRSIMWTLNFTMKASFFGPVQEKKYIKFVDTHIFESMDSTEYTENVVARPGLTANGEPTSSISDSIDWTNIDIDDDWGFITYIGDNES